MLAAFHRTLQRAGTVCLLSLVQLSVLQAQTGGSVLDMVSVEGDLSVGSEVSGALSSSDTRAPNDSYMEAWTIAGSPGESVTIDLIADDFDPFLYVTGPGFDATLSDDDSGGACYARITLTYLESGVFRVVASSNMPKRTGTYVLRVSDTPGPTAGYPCGGMNPAVLLDLPTEGRSLVLGDSATGSLTPASPAIGPEGKQAEAWRLDGRAGETVSVTLRSDAFDSYLYVAGPGLGEVLSDDDSGGDLNSQLTISFPQDGTYVVVASALNPNSLGSYVLQVEEPADMRDLPTEGRMLNPGSEAHGILSTTDPVVDQGRRGQAWELEGREGETYTIDLISDEFDCFLYVIGPGLSEPVTNDDGAGDLDARIRFTFPMEGGYLVIASALSSGEGPYTIRVEEAVGMNELPTEDRVVELGTVMAGWLSDSDPVIADGRNGQAWLLEGRGGDTYTVDLMSEDFDCYLYVAGPGFPDPLSNDDGGDGLDSRLSITLPEDGLYRIIASSLNTASMGEYRIRVTHNER